MKTLFVSGCISVVLVGSALSTQALSFSDATGETINGGILDITSVEVNNTATALTFKINLAGDPVATDWGKYMIGIDSAPGGDTAGNGWARPIRMSSGMDYFVGSWVDFGNGAEIRNWTGSVWNLQSATYNPNPDALAISKDTSSVTLMLNFAGLGLSTGSSFLFDVYTSGGGGSDSAIDALANPVQSVANWSDPYDSGQHVYSYTITQVPEPTTGLLFVMGGLLLLRRVRRWS
jgi:hypothetical protein